MEKINHEIWKKEADGSMTLVETREIEIEVPTVEDEIAAKEAAMLEMYKEIEALKAQK